MWDNEEECIDELINLKNFLIDFFNRNILKNTSA